METSKDFHDVLIDLILLMTDHISQILNVLEIHDDWMKGKSQTFIHREFLPKPIKGSHRTSLQDVQTLRNNHGM